MDGFGDDSTRDFFSQPDPYADDGGFDMGALDLNSQSQGWPHIGEYQGYLQSGTTGLPPLSGRGGDNRTLGLRSARNTGTGGAMPDRGTGAMPSHGSGPAGRGRRSPLAPVTARGRGVSMSSGTGGSRCREDDDMDNDADNDVEDMSQLPQHKSDKANCSENNNNLLCTLLVEQIGLGNYNKGTMTSRGYKEIIQKYYCATNLKHDRKQISNRIRQLKQMFQFIKDLHTNSGLGRDEYGWPSATLQWWEDATKGHSDWKKLRSVPPDYLPPLEQIF